MELIDTHCHLYLEDFKADISEVIKRGIEGGISKFYLPNIDSSSIKDLIDLESNYSENCSAMMGLHPCSVKENYQDEMKIIESLFLERKFVAVGEIGLDFYWDTTFKKEQHQVFEKQIQIGLEMNLPIVIHSRNSLNECIETVKKFQNGNLKGIFHCFGGTIEQALKIKDLGFYMGIGGVVTYKNSGLKDVIKASDLDQIVLETDAPYLTPVPFRGKRNESSYLKYVVTKLAEIMNINEETIAAATTVNAEKVFNS